MAGTLIYEPALPGHEVPGAPEPPPRWKRAARATFAAIRIAAIWLGHGLRNRWRRSSRNGRIAMATTLGIVAIVLLAQAVEVVAPPPSYLRITVAYPFRAAQIIVWVNQKQAPEKEQKEMINDVMLGSERRTAGPLRRAEGSYSQTLRMPAGPHTVRVRVASTEEPFDQTRVVNLQFTPGATTPLEIACNRGRMIAAVLEPESDSPRGFQILPALLANAWFAHYASPAFFGIGGFAMLLAIYLGFGGMPKRRHAKHA